jgi:tRNA pseudouridine32 synthase/23S rRNA pseudouridine746 synthase
MAETNAYYIVPKCDKEVVVLHEEEDFLLVEKPEFLLSIPGRGPENRDCMIHRLRQKYPTAQPCHRLDLDTSGIMIVALRPHALTHINRQFEQKKVFKAYEAVVDGHLREDEGVIDLPIGPDWSSRPRQKICHVTGKKAITRFVVMQRNVDDSGLTSTRVRLLPQTGRSHQLRLHLKEIGHPILGCDLYAHEAALARSPRLLLHACELGFVHPSSGHEVFGRSQPPF